MNKKRSTKRSKTKTKVKSPKTIISKTIFVFNYKASDEKNIRQDIIDSAVIYYGIPKLLKKLKHIYKNSDTPETEKDVIKDDIKWVKKRYEEQTKNTSHEEPTDSK